MKKISSLLFSAFALILCNGLCLAAQIQSYSISGKVLDSSNRQPLSGVYVTTEKNGGAQTDRNGEFTIKNLPAGEYKLTTMYFSDYSQDAQKVKVSGDVTGIIFKISQQARKMQQVVVTATRTEKHLADTPELTTVITERDIEKAGSTSLLESLQDNVPGLVISENAMGNNLTIRGLDSRRILFIVDGERMPNEGAFGNINLDQIDVNNIKRIEVLNGAASALYGSNAVGGVINIITKQPVHKFEGGANITATKNNTWRTRVDAGTATDKFSARVGGYRNSSDGYSTIAKYEDLGGDVKLGYNPTERIDLNLSGRYFRHEIKRDASEGYQDYLQTHNYSTAFNGGVRSADDRNQLRASVALDKHVKYTKSLVVGLGDIKNQTVTLVSSKLIDTYRLSDKWEFVGGTEFNYEETYAPTSMVSHPEENIKDFSGFAQADYSPVKELDIIAGGRYTHNSEFGSNFSPKLSAMYGLGDFRFRGSIGSAFRSPTIKELYYDFIHAGDSPRIGNPDLEAEKGIYSSISTEYDNGQFNASVAGYYNKIDNKITEVWFKEDDHDGYSMTYENVSSATLRGFDLNAAYTLINQIVFRANYSFCDAKNNDTHKQISSAPKHSGTGSVTWNGRIANSPFSLQLAGRMNSPTGFTDSSDKTKTQSVWKVTLVKPFRFNKHTFELTLKADNVFGFRDKLVTDPGRAFLVGLRYRFR